MLRTDERRAPLDYPALLNLVDAGLRAVAIRLAAAEPERVPRLLVSLARTAGPPPVAVPLIERLLEMLPEAPDAVQALVGMESWLRSTPTPGTALAHLKDDPRLAAELLRIFGASDYLAQVLVRDPWAYTLISDPPPLDPDSYARQLFRRLPGSDRASGRLDAMRRLKRTEMLRIAGADLSGARDLEGTVSAISTVADVLIRAACESSVESVDARFPTVARRVRFAVVAMGKLGARELNYSSDVDLVFLMDSPDPSDEVHRRYAGRLGEAILDALGRPTGEGICFRVDLRLRPEGRSGALVRSLPSIRVYYERFAETWERQALIKARAVAGDPELGAAFEALATQVAYRGSPGATLLEEVREMRALVERKLEATGALRDDVKEGRGTIRAVEFTVQLLQMLAGGSIPGIRQRGTLSALASLQSAGLLDAEEHRVLEGGYRFFREVEHRLQLLADLPVRRLPPSGPALRRLARATRKPGGSHSFEDETEFRKTFDEFSDAVVRSAGSIQSRLGLSTGVEDPFRSAILAADTAAGRAELRALLVARGYADPESGLDALEELSAGPPGDRHPALTRRLFADLAPFLLAECEASADASWSLAGMARYARRKYSYRTLFRSLHDDRPGLRTLCRLCGSAASLGPLLDRWPELAEVATDPEETATFRTRKEFESLLRGRLAAGSERERLLALRKFRLREYVRMAARHVTADPDYAAVTGEWSDLHDALLAQSLDLAVSRLHQSGRWTEADAAGFAVLALGRYGSRDLHFSSDLDLLYVHDERGGLGLREYEPLARALGDVIQEPMETGPLFEVDLRLRPEGRSGYAVVGLESAARYYAPDGRALAWEYQMLTRARYAAGSRETAEAFLELVRPAVFRDPVPAGWREEIRRMKHRIETERVSPHLADRNVKLGPGSLIDIEFLCQYLQLACGAATGILSPCTREILPRLAAAGFLCAADVAELLDAHRFFTRVRQAAGLLTDAHPADQLPDAADQPRLARALSRALGVTWGEIEASDRAHRREVRRVFDAVLDGRRDAPGGRAGALD